MNMILEHLTKPGTIFRIVLAAILMFGVYSEVGIYTFLVILWLVLHMESVALYVSDLDDENTFL